MRAVVDMSSKTSTDRNHEASEIVARSIDGRNRSAPSKAFTLRLHKASKVVHTPFTCEIRGCVGLLVDASSPTIAFRKHEASKVACAPLTRDIRVLEHEHMSSQTSTFRNHEVSTVPHMQSIYVRYWRMFWWMCRAKP